MTKHAWAWTFVACGLGACAANSALPTSPAQPPLPPTVSSPAAATSPPAQPKSSSSLNKSASALATSDDPFQPNACERRFPTIGVRFVERQSMDDVISARDKTPSFFGWDDVHSERTIAREVRASNDRAITQLRAWSKPSDQLVDGEFGSGPESLAHRFDLEGRFSDAVLQADNRAPGTRMAAAEKALRLLLEFPPSGVHNEFDLVEVRYKGERKESWGTALTLGLRVKGKDSMSGMCHTRWQFYDLTGEMVVRAADGALIELTAKGPLTFDETVCDSNAHQRPGQPGHIRGTKAARSIHYSRGCFAVAVAP